MLGEFLALAVLVSGTQGASEPEGCAVAVRYVKHILAARPADYVFSPVGEGWSEGFERANSLDKEPLDAAFLEKIVSEPRQNAVEACSSLRAELDARAIPYTRQAVEAAMWTDDPLRHITQPYGRKIFELTLPVLDGAGDQVFIQTAIQTGARFCATGSWIFRAEGDDWQPIAWRSGPLC